MRVWAVNVQAEARLLLCGFALLVGGTGAVGNAWAQTSDLVSKTEFRVCADPANIPMSNDKGEGFENKIAELFAEQLGIPVQYTWFPMATGFIRKTLRTNRCDVIIGYAQGHELVQNTNHYYTSSYVLITPKDSPLAGVDTLADPALQGERIGIVAGSPPATHMVRNGLMGKAKPYPLFVDRRVESPIEDMLSDISSGKIDAAVAWGPLAGPLIKAQSPHLQATPLIKETLSPRLFFRITMGVRKGEKVWQRQINSLIRRNQDAINAILNEAGVPLLNDSGTTVMELTESATK